MRNEEILLTVYQVLCTNLLKSNELLMPSSIHPRCLTNRGEPMLLYMNMCMNEMSTSSWKKKMLVDDGNKEGERGLFIFKLIKIYVRFGFCSRI